MTATTGTRTRRASRLVVGSVLALIATGMPIVDEVATAPPAWAATTATFTFTGGPQSWVVPAGVVSVAFDAYGASGGGDTASGGRGGRVTGRFPVTAGETLQIRVGGQGGTVGGWNGGGDRGAGPWAVPQGGGGASDIRQGGTSLGHRVVVAGGGGGIAHSLAGHGGHPSGTNAGSNGYNATQQGATGGEGGTQSGGGAGGLGFCGNGAPGGLGAGGAGGDALTRFAGGGGGGGYYGGGGGGAGCFWGGVAGGGGSSYTAAGVTDEAYETGTRSGNGRIVLVGNHAPGVPSLDAPAPGHTFPRNGNQTFQVTAVDADGDDYTATIQVTDTATSQVRTFSTGTVASGAPASVTLTVGSRLPPGTYSWRARARDAHDAGAWSASRAFSVAGPNAADVTATPLLQQNHIGDQAAVTVVALRSGAPAAGATVSISRSGANPAPPVTYTADSAGEVEYVYTGEFVGNDTVNIATTSGQSTVVTAQWYSLDQAASHPSEDCTTGNVVRGYTGTGHVNIRLQPHPSNPDEQWMCLAAQSGSTHVGGKVVLKTTPGALPPVVAVDQNQAQAESCRTFGERIEEGDIALVPFFVYVALNPMGRTGAWVCARVLDEYVRFRVTSDAPVAVSYARDPDTPVSYPELSMRGAESGACKANGGTPHLNLTVSQTKVGLYTWDAPGSAFHICFAASGAGGRVTVDTDDVPSLGGGTNVDNSCNKFAVIDTVNVTVSTIDPTAPTTPVGVCVTLRPQDPDITLRVTVYVPDAGPVALALD